MRRLLWGAGLVLACSGEQFSSDPTAGTGGGGSAAAGGTAALGGSAGEGAAAGASSAGGDGSGGSGRGGRGSAGAPTGGTSTGGASTGGASTGGASTGGAGGVPPAASCGDGPPDLTDPCMSGLKCTYGADPRPSCRDRYECSSGRWEKAPADCSPPVACDSLGELPVVNTACPSPGGWCLWDSGLACGCVACDEVSCPAASVWSCLPAPADPCPTLPPNHGQACESATAAKCTYGFCPIAYHFVATCEDGAFFVEAPACP